MNKLFFGIFLIPALSNASTQALLQCSGEVRLVAEGYTWLSANMNDPFEGKIIFEKKFTVQAPNNQADSSSIESSFDAASLASETFSLLPKKSEMINSGKKIAEIVQSQLKSTSGLHVGFSISRTQVNGLYTLRWNEMNSSSQIRSEQAILISTSFLVEPVCIPEAGGCLGNINAHTELSLHCE